MIVVFHLFPLLFPQAEDLKKMAQACQEDGCSVETVSNLLDQLKAKKKELQVYLYYIQRR